LGRDSEACSKVVARQALSSTGRLAYAHAAVAPPLEGFSPTPEIAEAQAMLGRL
jgi:hypothetical protein